MTGGRARRRTSGVARIPEIGAVVFDLDGVLVDSEPLHFRAANRLLARYGAAIDEAEYVTFIGLGERATWEAWRRRFAIAESAEHLCALNTEIRVDEITGATDVPAIGDAVQLARRLHDGGLRLAIASSSTRKVIDALLRTLQLDAVFPVRVSGEEPEVRHSKPAPDVYLAAAARLGLPPAACLAIEDSEPGVLSATRAGMTCIAVPNRWTAHQDFSAADVVLESLRYFPLLVL
jgi:HAD superfamily hydrolase (TIGR01509 family)